MKLSWAQKRVLWSFEKSIFQFFANFWVTKLKPWAQKRIFLALGKSIFLVFGKLLSDEVETILWESEVKCSTLFKSEFGHRKLLRKWFWRYLEIKKECSDRLNREFFGFLSIFHCQSLNHFSRNLEKSIQRYFNEHLVKGSFLENDFGATLRSKTSVVSVWKEHILFFLLIFDWRSWNHLLGKWGKALKAI